jgi:hypothetical protein
VTPDEQEAGSLKWERGGSVTIRQLRSGNFAMYQIGGIGSPFWIGPPEELFEAYAARPEVVYPVHVPLVTKVAGLDLSKVEFTL